MEGGENLNACMDGAEVFFLEENRFIPGFQGKHPLRVLSVVLGHLGFFREVILSLIITSSTCQSTMIVAIYNYLCTPEGRTGLE